MYVPEKKTKLAFLKTPNNGRVIVLTRNHGAVTSILLTDRPDDDVSGKASTMCISAHHCNEFLIPYVDDLIAPELNEQYNALQLHLTNTNQPLEGPLTSARAAYAMKKLGLTPAQAFEISYEQSKEMVAQQEARMKEIENVLNPNGRTPNVFTETWGGQNAAG